MSIQNLPDESSAAGALTWPEARTLGTTAAAAAGPMAGSPVAVLPGVIAYSGAEQSAALTFASTAPVFYLDHQPAAKYADPEVDPGLTVAPRGDAGMEVLMAESAGYRPHYAKGPFPQVRPTTQDLAAIQADGPGVPLASSEAAMLALLGV